MNIAILTNQFHPEVLEVMTTAAKQAVIAASATVTHEVATTGVFDMPVVADALLRRTDVDAVVVLGAVEQGDTQHDALVVNTASVELVRLSTMYKKPIGFGIIGPGASKDMFMPRAEEYGQRAVEAVVESWNQLQSLA